MTCSMPTLKQKLAFKKMSEKVGSPGKSSVKMGKILREAGYSESVSKSPKKVTNSLGWRELLDYLLPDEVLLAKHLVLLNSKKLMVVAKALDLAYKLKGYYKSAIEPSSTDPYDSYTDEELMDKLRDVRKQLNQPPITI